MVEAHGIFIQSWFQKTELNIKVVLVNHKHTIK